MQAILKRELKSYFTSPLMYVILGVFLILTTVYFFAGNIFTGSPLLDGLFYNINVMLVFLVPILTMRLFTEEKTQRTDQLLLTSPVSISSIVLGKFLSAFVVFAIMISTTFIFEIVLGIFGSFNFPHFVLLIIGELLLGAAFISIGLFISSVFGNVVITCLVSFGVLMLTYFADAIPMIMQNNPMLVKIFSFFSLSSRFSSFGMGVLNPESIIYYLSFTAVFIYLTIRVIDKKRWA